MIHSNQGPRKSLDIVSTALDNNQLFELFTGQVSKVHDEYAAVPTSDEYIFTSWLAFLNSQPLPHDKWWDLFKLVIIQMSDTETWSWFSVYYLYRWLNHSKRSHAYPADMQQTITALLTNISRFKETYVQDFRWVGHKATNYSVWRDVERIVKNMADDHSFTFSLGIAR